MLIALTFAAALVGQAAPPAPPHAPSPAGPRSETRSDVRVIQMGGPDGPPDLDRNRDGFVTRDEFTAPQTAAFDMLDANRDGRISIEEFTSGRAAAHVILGGPGGPGSPANLRFRMDGPDGPGPMGDGQVMTFRHEGPGGTGGRMGPAGPGRPGTDIQIHTIGGPGGHEGPGDLDTDHDGKVSEGEFLAPMREAFQQMDADHSGSLEAGEHGRGGGPNTFIMRRGGPAAPPAD